MFKTIFLVPKENRPEVIQKLIDHSYPGGIFFVMVGVSVVIATIGLIEANIPIVIGGMLVAPFLASILSLAMGIVLADFALIRRSLVILAKAVAVAIIVSFVITILLPPPPGELNVEILSRGSVRFPLLYVAIASGVAAAFAVAKPKKLKEYLVGVAVSVSLLPPLANVGVGLGTLHFRIATGSFQFFLLNLIGIIFAGIVVFSLMGFYIGRRVVPKAIEKEQEKLEQGISD